MWSTYFVAKQVPDPNNQRSDEVGHTYKHLEELPHPRGHTLSCPRLCAGLCMGRYSLTHGGEEEVHQLVRGGGA